jgi:hypothetical protein
MIKYLTKYLLHGITIKSEEDLPTNCRDDLRRVVQALPVEIRSRIDAISVDTLHDWCFVLKYSGDYEHFKDRVAKTVEQECSPRVIDCWFTDLNRYAPNIVLFRATR